MMNIDTGCDMTLLAAAAASRLPPSLAPEISV
jgi:hypothetical protein